MKKLISKLAFGLVAFGIMAGSVQAAEKYPAFSLAWSEYPSWSIFGVAHKFGLINGDKGKYGPIEERWKVDIVLKEAEYDPTREMYGTGEADAVCVTNTDSLQLSLRANSVGILATSTSYGADAAVVVKNTIGGVKDLKNYSTYGLEKSVSQYTFVRNLEKLGENPSEYKFVNMDPGIAAMVMQQRNPDYKSILVWNPFAMETLNKRPDTTVLFDSRSIPGEIIDMVIMSEKSLNREGGDRFANAVIDTFYSVNERVADPATRDETLIAIGEKFSHLNLESMKKVVRQTRFYETPEQALSLFTGGEAFPGGKVETNGNLENLMKQVVKTCVEVGIADSAPTIGYGTKAETGDVNLRFDPTYIKNVVTKKNKK